MYDRSTSAPPSRLGRDAYDLTNEEQRREFIKKAFEEQVTGIDLLESDFPKDKSEIFYGKSKTTTPIGEASFGDPEFILNTIDKMFLSTEQKLENNDTLKKFFTSFCTEKEIQNNGTLKSMALGCIKDQEGSRLLQECCDS